MNTPTRIAPHIWWKERRNTSPICAAFSLPIASSSSSTMIQAARIAVPPTQGAKLNTALTLPLGTGQSLTSEEQASACVLNQLTFGSGDHGPVQAATTTRSTTNGIHACSTSWLLSPWPRFSFDDAATTGTPP